MRNIIDITGQKFGRLGRPRANRLIRQRRAVALPVRLRRRAYRAGLALAVGDDEKPRVLGADSYREGCGIIGSLKTVTFIALQIHTAA
jgi:hypothetical protein